MSCATNKGDTFLIDGKKLKSINRYFNKKISKLQQKNIENGISKRIVTNNHGETLDETRKTNKRIYLTSYRVVVQKSKRT